MRGPPATRKLTLAPLVAATWFMVSGGPYGLEELIHEVGFHASIIVLLVTPLVWSLPTALMVGELSSAIPESGGYYAWVRRALGPFWGFQEAWLSLAASVFDMAIYPTLFALYLGKLWPVLGSGMPALALGGAMIAACAALNVMGARSVGGASIVMTLFLLSPFAVLAICALLHTSVAASSTSIAPRGDFIAGLLVAMWNYMGWDNASTIATEVDRPQRTYPIAMVISVTLVALTYLIPVGAVGLTGMDASHWDTGSWVDAGTALGGRTLGLAIVLGGVVCAFGMFNALVLSYSRLPVALANDGYLPSILTRLHPRTGAPYVAIIVCALAWAACLRLGFARLVELDVILYGLSLLLEFIALFVLRLREPQLPRPFRIPGGLVGAALAGLFPAALIGLALWHGRAEQAGSLSALSLGSILVLAGPVIYWASIWVQRRRLALSQS